MRSARLARSRWDLVRAYERRLSVATGGNPLGSTENVAGVSDLYLCFGAGRIPIQVDVLYRRRQFGELLVPALCDVRLYLGLTHHGLNRRRDRPSHATASGLAPIPGHAMANHPARPGPHSRLLRPADARRHGRGRLLLLAGRVAHRALRADRGEGWAGLTLLASPLLPSPQRVRRERAVVHRRQPGCLAGGARLFPGFLDAFRKGAFEHVDVRLWVGGIGHR